MWMSATGRPPRPRGRGAWTPCLFLGGGLVVVVVYVVFVCVLSHTPRQPHFHPVFTSPFSPPKKQHNRRGIKFADAVGEQLQEVSSTGIDI